jgi:hypothetical protein
MDYFIRLNPQFLVSVAQEYATHFGEEPIDQATPIPLCLARASKLLEIVGKAAPGHKLALLLLAQTRFVLHSLSFSPPLPLPLAFLFINSLLVSF